jgi:RNA polymerase sigma factor (TIGR02999 family)
MRREFFRARPPALPGIWANWLIFQQVDFASGRGYRESASGLDGHVGGRYLSHVASQPVSALLGKWQAGDREALRALMPLVYADLRRLAHRFLRKERPGHTLQSAALVNEAYLRFTKREKLHFDGRSDFFAASAQLMRQILVDYARGHRAAKRDGGLKLELDEATALPGAHQINLVALDDALNELSRLDPQQGRVVELRFFGGLSIEETSEALGVSPATVKRDWTTARVWLHKQLSRV